MSFNVKILSSFMHKKAKLAKMQLFFCLEAGHLSSTKHNCNVVLPQCEDLCTCRLGFPMTTLPLWIKTHFRLPFELSLKFSSHLNDMRHTNRKKTLNICTVKTLAIRVEVLTKFCLFVTMKLCGVPEMLALTLEHFSNVLVSCQV